MAEKEPFKQIEGEAVTEPLVAIDRYSDNTATSYPIDRFYHAFIGKMMSGISPASLYLAYMDWAVHVMMSPGHQLHLVEKSWRKTLRFLSYSSHYFSAGCKEHCIDPLPQDQRFNAEEWQQFPFNFIHQGFLLTQQWWYNATTGVRGVSKHHEDVVAFVARQLLDMVAPSNYLMTNPELLHLTVQEGGSNLIRGAINFMEDAERFLCDLPPIGAEAFQVGKNLAVSKGNVIFRNTLIELIQYSPSGKEVYAEPVLIVPAWIMKYYILDLSPDNSLVKYLVDRGHTVFMISWKNPDEHDRNLSLEDYRKSGIMAALQVISEVTANQKIHTVGYCLGGTLLAITAATMVRDDDDRLQSVTLLAAQTDFEEAGELLLFIDESQVTFLEDVMWDKGFLDKKQMSKTFQLLRSNDLIWSKLRQDYFRGQRSKVNDLMAWNNDATRMPYQMHMEYLRKLFMDNDLAEGRYKTEGEAIAVSNIKRPLFVVSTVKDHVAPWKSVYKIHLLTDSDVTFILTTGGHNAGIVSEPGHKGRKYQCYTTPKEQDYFSPEKWLEEAPVKEGSWWNEWQAWLVDNSSNTMVQPPISKQYKPLAKAPGTYVLME